MTADERARAVCEDMASGPLVLEVPFDEWVGRKVAEAIRAAVEEEREGCARTLEGMLPGSGRVSRPDRAWGEKAIAAIRARGARGAS
jgi:hypothetical protein